MNNELFASVKFDKESLEAYDVGYLRELIAHNSRKIDQQLKELDELKSRISAESPRKAIA